MGQRERVVCKEVVCDCSVSTQLQPEPLLQGVIIILVRLESDYIRSTCSPDARERFC